MECTHYECKNCGNVFPKEELKERFEYGRFYVCPRCESDDLKEADLCKECGKVLNENEVGCSLCKDCLFELLDYDIGYNYIVENNELPIFIFEYVFDTQEPEKTSDLLMQELKMMFQRKKVEDLLYNKPLLLNKIKEYIENDLWHFSDYLKEKGVI